jgi:hypothetical protein
VIDPKQFHLDIEELVARTGCTYMDAILEYQLSSAVEIETVSALVKQNVVLKARVQEEAEQLRLVKATVRRLRFDP